MRHDNVDWCRRYYKAGDPCAVYPFPHKRVPAYIGVVERVTKNHYGRLSYIVNGKTVLAEELFPAHGQAKLKIRCNQGETK